MNCFAGLKRSKLTLGEAVCNRSSGLVKDLALCGSDQVSVAGESDLAQPRDNGSSGR